MNKQTADRLAELRKNQGYSQEELADAIGVSRQAVSKWERGESSPDTDNLIELARLYHVTLDELVNGTELPEKEKSAASEKESFCWRDEDMTVEIKEDEIMVKNGDGEEKTYEKEAWRRKRAKEKRINVTVSGAFALLATVAYLLLGFYVNDGWAIAWPIFILIPFVASIVEFCFYKRLAAIAFPCLVAAVYCFVGMKFGIWHPTWAMFLAIPAYYLIANSVDRVTRAKDYEAIEDAFDEKEGKRKR